MATVAVQQVDTNGDTNYFNGLVERNGNFWVEDIPLTGTNWLTLTVTDSAGNVATTNITVSLADITMTIDPPDASVLWNQSITATGTISDTDNYTVWVNGTQATVNSDGTWAAASVPLPPGGTALLQARAISNSDNDGYGNLGSGTSSSAAPPSGGVALFAAQVTGNSGAATTGRAANGGAASYDFIPNPSPTSQPPKDVESQTTRPPQIYVQYYEQTVDQQNTTEYSDYFIPSLAFWESASNSVTTHGEYHWTNGQGGSGSQKVQSSYNWTEGTNSGSNAGEWTSQQTWPATDWPDLTNGTQTASGDYDWENFDPVISPPNIVYEEGSVHLKPKNDWVGYNYPGTDILENGGYHGIYDRSATARVMLRTGGKGGSLRQNLFRLSATAQQNTATNTGSAGGAPGVGYLTANIPPQNIQIMGKTLGADGNLFVALADNKEVGITPNIPSVPYFTFIPDQQKYKLNIVVNGIQPLSENNVRVGAQYCVGQKLQFSPLWSPPLPNGATASTVKWTFDGTFVNKSWQYQMGGGTMPLQPVGSLNYTNDTTLLENEITSAWWISGGAEAQGKTYKAHLGEGLTFANGQNAVATSQGCFNMFRPSVVMENRATHGTPANVWIKTWNSSQFGTIGLGSPGGPNNMSYNVQVLSSIFPGYAKITQICALEGTSLLSINVSNELDNIDPYPNATSNILTNSVNPFTGSKNNIINLDDAPQNGWWNSFHLNARFVDFIMFDPGTPGSIPVPLGKVIWATSFGAAYPSTNITPNSISGPTDPDGSQDWPTWTSVFHNPNN